MLPFSGHEGSLFIGDVAAAVAVHDAEAVIERDIDRV
jgi:hypothetical protein